MSFELGYVDYDELDVCCDEGVVSLGETLRDCVARQLVVSFVTDKLSVNGIPREMGGTGTADDVLGFDEWFSTYWIDSVLVDGYGRRTVVSAFYDDLRKIWAAWRREVEDRAASAIPSRH